MGKIIAIANQKGGVGKTTTCVNLAASLGVCGRNVLLIDLDPQGNATMGSGVDKSQLKLSVYDILLRDISTEKVIVQPEKIAYGVVPANADLTAAEVGLLKLSEREFRLKKALAIAKNQYDYILIDCPPTLNMLTINALVAANGVIIPMQCEYYPLEGLSGLLDTVSQLQRTVNASLQLEGIVRTMFDTRARLSADVSAQLFSHFGDKLYKTRIPRNVRLAEAPSFGLPAWYYDEKSPGAQAYMNLATEFLLKNGQVEKTPPQEQMAVTEAVAIA